MQTHLPLMFPHLLHLVHLSKVDELYDFFLSQAHFVVTRSLRKFRNRALSDPAEWNKLPDFIRKSSSLTLFKTNCKTYFFKILWFLLMSSVFVDSCTGSRSCKISVFSRLFGDPCPKISKYLEVYFGCIRGKSVTFLQLSKALRHACT